MSQPPTEVPLEHRIQQLESAVAALQNTHALEQRVAERVTQHLQDEVSAEHKPLAQALAENAVGTVVGPKLASLPWLLIDSCRELVAMFRMFFDFHYKVAWSTRLLTFILLPAILLSHWWMPVGYVPFVGGILDKLLDVILAFVMFKALHRDARRYMETRNPSGRS